MQKWFMAAWLLGATAVLAADSTVYPPQNIMQVTAPDKAAYTRLLQLGLDIPEQRLGPEVTVIGSEAEREWLEARGYTVTDVLPRATTFYAARASAAGTATMGGFRTLAEIWTAVDSLIDLYPAVVSDKLTIGTSLEGRPIYAIRISDNPNTDEFSEPAVLITGLHHAREPMGAHIAIYTMQQFATNYGSDPEITTLVNEREIWFIPAINPDGYAFNETTAPGGGGMWRKNRRDNLDGTFGVDPNRNYGMAWGYDDIGSSGDPAAETYRGSGPFSEPENQTIRQFCIDRPNIRIAFNYHSYSNLLLYPWGYFVGYTPDHALFAAIGDSATAVNGYYPTPGWQLYLTNGDSDDWMYDEQGILAFTPEVGTPPNVPPFDGFWPDPSRIEPLTLENYPANLFITRIADAPERLLPPQPPTVDSIIVAGVDSLQLFWHSNDTTSNTPVSYDLAEFFGPYRIVDDIELPALQWELAGFERTSAKAFAGSNSLYSTTGDNLVVFATTTGPLLADSTDTLRFWIDYNIETDFDYGYVEVSTDGGETYLPIAGNITTVTNPNGRNLGHGITDSSGGWIPAAFPLTEFADQVILIRFAYRTDGYVFGPGMYIDNISPIQVYDSIGTVATTSSTTEVLADHPPGDYFFGITGTDAEGQQSVRANVYYCYEEPPTYLMGDVDASGLITAADVVYLLNYAFKAGPEPIPVPDVGNVNGVGLIDGADVVYLINYAFKAGPPPVEP